MTTLIIATIYIVPLVTVYGFIGYFLKEAIKGFIELMKED